MYPVICAGSPRCQWQTHNILVADSAIVKLWKFPTWVEKRVEFPQSCTQPREKVFLQTNGNRWKTYSPKGVPFWVSTQQMSTISNGEIQNPEKFGFQKFVSSTLSNVEKFTGFNGEILYSNLTTNSVDIARNWVQGVSRHTKSTGMHHDSSYIQQICAISVANTCT